MRIAALLFLAAALCGVDPEPNLWKGINLAIVGVVNDGPMPFDAESIKSAIEMEFRKAGIRCGKLTDPNGPNVNMALAYIGVTSIQDDVHGIFVYVIQGSCATIGKTRGNGFGYPIIESEVYLGTTPIRKDEVDGLDRIGARFAVKWVNNWLRDNPR